MNARDLAKRLLRVSERSRARRMIHAFPHFGTSGWRNASDRLKILCDRYGSDKGSTDEHGAHTYWWPPHTYSDVYQALFGHCREHIRLVFECGLGTNNTMFGNNMTEKGRPGASLRAWRDYFPNATIVGADIDEQALFTEHRISTHYVDQLNRHSIDQMWAQVGLDGFDLMLDDGLHTFEAGVSMFEGSFGRLRPGGVYVIEDVSLASLDCFDHYFARSNLWVEFVVLDRHKRPPFDNNLVIVRKRD